MKVIIVKNAAEGGKKAFEIFKEKLDEGATVFGLATGGTPETTYQELCDSDLDFSNCISINLDEYVGLSADNPQSYHYYMKKHLFEKKPFAHSYLPDGQNDGAKAECERYSKIIAENPVDLQLLGIGRNGHIGFNEPGSAFDGKTQKIRLTESTIAANARYFENEMTFRSMHIRWESAKSCRQRPFCLRHTARIRRMQSRKWLKENRPKKCLQAFCKIMMMRLLLWMRMRRVC